MSKKIRFLTGKGSGQDKDASAFYNDMAADILGRTVWGEARSEGTYGMEAMASVILNRVAVAEGNGGKYWWGNDVISVCQKAYQFSCWNRSDTNYQKLRDVTEQNIHFATALRIARRAMAGALPDATNGATHYHTKDIKPHWARGKDPVATIGSHIFYTLEM
jgi:N-acetylmuramoyl-L-alanine amidase